jgi:hypothetical protein
MFAELFVPFFLAAVAVWVMIVVGFGLLLNRRATHGPW